MVLTIISIIATPIVINIINESKEESELRSIELYINHVQKALTKKQMSDPNFNPDKCKIQNKGNLSCFINEQFLGTLNIEINGLIPTDGELVIKNNKIKYKYVIINNKTYSKFDFYDKMGNEYKKIDYLESTGKQYINTEYYITSTTKIDMNIKMKYIEKDQKILGSYGGSGLCLGTLGSKWRFGSSTWDKNIGIVNLEKTHIVIEKNKFEFNGDVYYATNISANRLYPLVVFGIAYGGKIYQKDSIILYDLKIYDSGIIKRDYVPVINKDNVPCLFDKVESKCYYNEGTDEFTWK